MMLSRRKIVGLLLLVSSLYEVESIAGRSYKKKRRTTRGLGIGNFEGRSDYYPSSKSGSKSGSSKSGSKGEYHHGHYFTTAPTKTPTLPPTPQTIEGRVPIIAQRPVGTMPSKPTEESNPDRDDETLPEANESPNPVNFPVPTPKGRPPKSRPVPAPVQAPSFWFPSPPVSEPVVEVEIQPTEGRFDQPTRGNDSDGNNSIGGPGETNIDVDKNGEEKDSEKDDKADDEDGLSQEFQDIFGGNGNNDGSTIDIGNGPNDGGTNSGGTTNDGGRPSGKPGNGVTDGQNIDDGDASEGGSNGTGNANGNNGAQNNGSVNGGSSGSNGTQNGDSNGSNGNQNGSLDGNNGVTNGGTNGSNGIQNGGSESDNNGGSNGNNGNQNSGSNMVNNGDSNGNNGIQDGGINGNNDSTTGSSNGDISVENGGNTGNNDSTTGGSNGNNSVESGGNTGNIDSTTGGSNGNNSVENGGNTGNNDSTTGGSNGNIGSQNGGNSDNNDSTTGGSNGNNGIQNGGSVERDDVNDQENEETDGTDDNKGGKKPNDDKKGKPPKGENNGRGEDENVGNGDASNEGIGDEESGEETTEEEELISDPVTAVFCPNVSPDKEVLVNWKYAIKFNQGLTAQQKKEAVTVMELQLVSEILECSQDISALPGKRAVRKRNLMEDFIGIAGLNYMPLDTKHEDAVCLTSGGVCETYLGRMEMYLQEDANDQVAIDKILHSIRDTMQRNDFPVVEGIIKVWYLEPDLSNVSEISGGGAGTDDFLPPEDGSFSTGTVIAFAALGVFVFAALILGAFRMRRSETDGVSTLDPSTMMTGSVLTGGQDSYGSKQPSAFNHILPNSYKLDDAHGMSAIPEGDSDCDSSRYQCSVIVSDGGYTSDGDSRTEDPLYPAHFDPALGARELEDENFDTENDLLFENTENFEDISAMNDAEFSNHRKSNLVTAEEIGLGGRHSTVDVHQCNSSSCKICNYRPKDVEFIHNSPSVSTGQFFNVEDDEA